ncbi:MAG TPA: DUF1491 family protein [Tabrizicola sp.]|nr:DUF1491 family protein [Tabrizicola sp.]
MSPRLASGVWVSAYLTRLRLANIPAYVTAKGDAEAGAVVVKVALMDGTARAYERRLGLMNGPGPLGGRSRGPGRGVRRWTRTAGQRDGRARDRAHKRQPVAAKTATSPTMFSATWAGPNSATSRKK